MHSEPSETGAATPQTNSLPYDAIMLCSYGGPRKNEDVLPFMRNATNGRGVPDERLLEVSGHYRNFHGISPINARNLELRQALAEELRRRGVNLEVTVGNRNWTPFFTDTLCDLAVQGKKRVLCVFTSAYVCYSGCRQYREDLAAATAQLETQEITVQLDKIRPYYTTAGFINANYRRLLEAVQKMRAEYGEIPQIAFVTHSIPTPMEQGSGPADRRRPSYHQQHLSVCEELASRLKQELQSPVEWDLAFCSRSGPPQMPWLEPDINDKLAEYAQAGIKTVITVPIGFICDHMEVVFDLDTEAKETAAELGLNYYRVGTIGTDPEFVSALVDLIFERAAQAYEPDDDPKQVDAKPNPARLAETDILSPIWPAWPGSGDSVVSPKGADLPVACQSETLN